MLCCRKDVRWVVRIAAWGIICLSIEKEKKKRQRVGCDLIRKSANAAGSALVCHAVVEMSVELYAS